MKYRIKIYTYRNGRQEFEPQVKKWIFWNSLDFDGKEFSTLIFKYKLIQIAFDCIEAHYNGNNTLKKVEIEYVDPEIFNK